MEPEATDKVQYVLVTPEVNEGPTIAIDLGTSFAYVSVPIEGKTQILTHGNGDQAFPCYVSFNQNQRLIGAQAKEQAVKNPQNTVYDCKRIIGRPFNDPLIQHNLKRWPFKVEADDCNRPRIVVTYKGQTKKFYAEEILAMILIRLKEAAEKRLKQPVKKAVITVPAYFRDGQRQATRDAATIAGLKVQRLINEPSASAIAYGMSSTFPTNQVKVLVYEFGEGTFDASVVNIEDGFIQILSTVGDSCLGAQDFDNKMVDYCVEEFQKKTEKKLEEQWIALQKLKKDCSKLRRSLSSSLQGTIKIDDLVEGVDFEHQITRKDWEAVVQPTVKKTVDLVHQALKSAHVEQKDIKIVILAGGATHLPIVSEVVKELFPGAQIYDQINKDHVVITGAGILAADITRKKEGKKPMLLINVTPMSIGMEVNDGEMFVLIPRDTSIPTMKKHTFTTTEDNQEAIIVRIYEGQSKKTQENFVLGTFKIIGIPAAPKGHPSIEVELHVDADGILTVKAQDTTASKELETPVLKWALSKTEVEKLKESGFYYEETKLPKKPSHLDEID